jgi:hypothetical protein
MVQSKSMPEAYERPSLQVLGTAHELTQGPVTGPRPDSLFVLHKSP